MGSRVQCARKGLWLGLLVGLFITAPARAGYVLNTLAAFKDPNGFDPVAGLTLSGGTLYGTTVGGGVNEDGSIFSVPLSGGSPTTLATFNSTTGEYPYAGLTLSGSTLYGTTVGAGPGTGPAEYGTVFSLPISGGSPTTLATFNFTNGAGPSAGLTLSGSTLYGTTQSGGAGGYGTVFSVPLSGGSPTTLATFNSTNGASPSAGLILSGGTLYGTTQSGGARGYGTVFSVPLGGGSPTTLATFNNTNGATPYAGLTLSGSTLYGTTSGGGANLLGTVFSVPLSGGSPTTLATFNNTNGANPQCGLTLSGSTLYGTTEGGGADRSGTVFSVPLSGGSPTTLATFNGINGMGPLAGVILSGSTLYGTASQGGPYGYYNNGTVFSVSLTNPSPILSLTPAAPFAFGSNVGTLTLSGSHGSYTPGTASFTATPTGYLAATGFNPVTDSKVFALNLTDSVPAHLAADLADAVSELNSATTTGYTLTASTIDPTGIFGGYNLFITLTNDTLGTGSPYFGFDFTQLNGTTDTLSVSSAAAVPEPASRSLLALGGLALLQRSRKNRASKVGRVDPTPVCPPRAEDGE